MNEDLPIYNRATQNIGDPPHAEAYCRCLAMEVERLARKAERSRIAKMICEDCRNGVPLQEGLHSLYFDGMKVPCKAAILETER